MSEGISPVTGITGVLEGWGIGVDVGAGKNTEQAESRRIEIPANTFIETFNVLISSSLRSGEIRRPDQLLSLIHD